MLVTGGARRVGRAICVVAAQRGYDVALHYHRSEAEAAETAAMIEACGGRCEPICADLGDATRYPLIVEAAVGAFGRLDALVNNASLFRAAGGDALDDVDASAWEYMLRVNLIAPAALSRAAAPHLSASGRGRIINLCDISADRPWARHLSYCASKAGLVNLTKSLARTLAPRVQVNGVAPGIAEFPEEYDEATRKRLIARVPAGRAGTPEEIADVVGYLLDAPDYLTGQIIAVDGGRGIA